MAKKRKNLKRMKKQSSGAVAVILLALILIIGLVGVFYEPIAEFVGDLFGGGYSDSDDDYSSTSEGSVTVHFVDVGQGDCTIICTENGNVIIDAGTNSSEEEMQAYIDKLGIKSFKYAIFTHPHEDHIGGAEVILRNYKVDNVIIPDYEATTKVYTTMLDAIDESGANVKVIEANEEYSFSVGSLKAKILAPVEFDDETNNSSIVTRFTFAKTSFLIMGDAEEDSEELILQKYNKVQLKADIIKLGHHGSNTSSSREFLEAVSPKVAIISCGVDNKYGHPHQVTLEKLSSLGVKYHRTDKEGSIVYVISSDGYKLK